LGGSTGTYFRFSINCSVDLIGATDGATYQVRAIMYDETDITNETKAVTEQLMRNDPEITSTDQIFPFEITPLNAYRLFRNGVFVQNINFTIKYTGMIQLYQSFVDPLNPH